jgi:hypothetical protein
MLFGMTLPPDSENRERALDALAIARRQRLPLGSSARLVGLSPSEVLRHVGEGFEKKGSRWVPRPHDRIPRHMSVLTPSGPVSALIDDSREATLNAEHANAVQRYLQTGQLDHIVDLPRRHLRTRGGRLPLATSAADLDRLAEGSEITYDVYLRF